MTEDLKYVASFGVEAGLWRLSGGVSPEMTPHIRSFKTFVAANMLFLLQGRTSSHHLTDDKISADDKPIISKKRRKTKLIGLICCSFS